MCVLYKYVFWPRHRLWSPAGATRGRNAQPMYSPLESGTRRYIPRISSGTVGNFCISKVSPQRGAMCRQKIVEATVEVHAKTL